MLHIASQTPRYARSQRPTVRRVGISDARIVLPHPFVQVIGESDIEGFVSAFEYVKPKAHLARFLSWFALRLRGEVATLKANGVRRSLLLRLQL
jgi:hypothetical protein